MPPWGAVVGGILGCSHAHGLTASGGEVLAHAGMLFVIKVSFHKDV